MKNYDILIKNGTIIDGTQSPRFIGDILIQDGMIARIGANLEKAGFTANKIIDATGKIIAPGVIDLHTHYDAQIHWDPYCTNSGWHGTTSVTIGNCGFGFAPCRPEDRERSMKMMETTEQIPAEVVGKAMPWNWIDFPEWIAHLRTIPKGINVSTFVPLNSLMIYVMGIDAAKTRSATKEERAEMARILNEAMDAGAIGFAFSYLREHNSHTDSDGSPMPSDVMDPEEAFLLGEVLRERGEGIIQALVDLPGLGSHREIIEELAERSQRPILHNILQIVDVMPEYHESILQFLDDMAAKGHNVYSHGMAMHTWTEFNFVDFNFWDGVGPVFREFSISGDRKKKLELAQNPDYQARFRAAYDPEAMMGAAGGSLESYKLVNAHGHMPYKDYEGLLLSEIAEKENCDICDVFFNLFIGTEGLAEVRTTINGSENPHNIGRAIKHPRVLIGTSDGGAHIKFWSGGQFSTDVLTWLCRDEKIFTLEEVHYKMSYLPARFAGMAKRGALLEGYYADIMVYDLDKLGFNLNRYDVVNDLPDGSYRRVVRAQGIEAILCNGEVTFMHDECTHAVPGMLLTAAA